MSVTVNVEKIGTFSKCADKFSMPASPLPRLNEDRRLYGSLNEEMDLTIECKGPDASESDDSIDSLLEFILKTSTHGTVLSEAIGAEFLTTSRILNALARTAYKHITIQLVATRQSDVIFLKEKELPALLPTTESPQYLQKFKQYMTLDEAGNPNDTFAKMGPIQNSNIFDAVDEAGNFITIKTTVGGHRRWVEKQSLRQYLTSFLAGIPYTIFGHRVSTRAQSINEVSKVTTDELPKDRVRWNANLCFDQLFKILQKIESSLELDGDVATVTVMRGEVTCEIDDIENFKAVDPEFLKNFD